MENSDQCLQTDQCPDQRQRSQRQDCPEAEGPLEDFHLHFRGLPQHRSIKAATRGIPTHPLHARHKLVQNQTISSSSTILSSSLRWLIVLFSWWLGPVGCWRRGMGKAPEEWTAVWLRTSFLTSSILISTFCIPLLWKVLPIRCKQCCNKFLQMFQALFHLARLKATHKQTNKMGALQTPTSSWRPIGCSGRVTHAKCWFVCVMWTQVSHTLS